MIRGSKLGTYYCNVQYIAFIWKEFESKNLFGQSRQSHAVTDRVVTSDDGRFIPGHSTTSK